MHRYLSLFITTLAISLSTTALADVTAVGSVSDLSFSPVNGAAVISNAGGTLEVQTSKNSSVTASLPAAIAIPNTDDFLTVTFDITFDNVPANTGSTFGVGLADSSSGGYFYEVIINPLASTSGVTATLAEGGDSNLGKKNTTGFGTTTHTVSFTITNIAIVEDLNLTATGDVIAGGSHSAGLDVQPATTTSLDTVYFEFNGDAWNETFAPDNQTIKATITNFSVTTNVPEPGALGLIVVGGLCLLPRRR